MALVTLKRLFWALKLLVLIFRSHSSKKYGQKAMVSIFKIDLNVKNHSELPSSTVPSLCMVRTRGFLELFLIDFCFKQNKMGFKQNTMGFKQNTMGFKHGT